MEKLDRLPSALERAITSPTDRPWEDCNNLNPPGELLPAGAFIESLKIFAETGIINAATALEINEVGDSLELFTETFSVRIITKYFEVFRVWMEIGDVHDSK